MVDLIYQTGHLWSIGMSYFHMLHPSHVESHKVQYLAFCSYFGSEIELSLYVLPFGQIFRNMGSPVTATLMIHTYISLLILVKTIYNLFDCLDI